MRETRSLAVAALLVLLVAAIYARTLRHAFVNFDDFTYIVDNPIVNRGFSLAGLVAAFEFHAFNWHPLTWLSHMLDVQIFGLRPAGHHLTNLLLHAANAVLLFGVLHALTGAFARSALVAALFAAHPLHVESVAWAAERKDVLSAAFWFLSIGAWVRHLRRPGRSGLAGVAAVYALGLAAKPMLVTLPLVLLLLDAWPLGRFQARPGAGGGAASRARELVLEKWPLFALAIANGLVTLVAQNAGLRRAIEPALPLRLENALVSLAAYLAATFWPSGLAVFYPYPLRGIPWHQVAAAAALLGLVTAGCARRARREPALLAGWLWFLVTLLPVIGLYQVGAQARADRYTYLPLVGIFVLLVWAAAPRVRAWALPAAAAAAGTALVAALAVASWNQAGYWRDSVTLMLRAVSTTRDNVVALTNLGTALSDEQDRPDAALPYLEEALRLLPDDPDARFNRGQALLRLGRHAEAAEALARAIEVAPGALDARYALGLALLRLGRAAEAVTQFSAVVEVAPEYSDARIQLAIARTMAARP